MNGLRAFHHGADRTTALPASRRPAGYGRQAGRRGSHHAVRRPARGTVELWNASSWLALVSLLFLTIAPAMLQAEQAPEENTRLIPDPQVSGAWTLQWNGRSGRTYFLQNSHDLKTWTYLNTIQHGDGAKMQGVSSTGQKYFLRLRHTDIPCADPATADFDADGLNNADELFWLCDPFVADSDGDGFSDGWEVLAGMDPNQNNAANAHLDPDNDGWDNTTEHLYNTNPNLADSDGDQLNDPDDADPNDQTIDWPRAPEATRVWIPLTGYNSSTHGAPVALSNTGIALFEKAIWKAGVWKNLEWEKDGPGLGIPDGPNGPEVLSTTIRAIRALDIADDGRILGKAELLFTDPYGGDAGAPGTSQHAVQWTGDTNGNLVMELTGLNVGGQIDMGTYWSLPKPAGVSPDGVLFTSGPGTPASGGTGGASASVEEWRRHPTNQWQASANPIFAQQGAELVPFEILGGVWMQARNTVLGGKMGVIRIGEEPNLLLEATASTNLPTGPGYVGGALADHRVAFISSDNETQTLLLRPASGIGDFRPVPKLAGTAAFNARGEAISHDGRFWQNGNWFSPVSEGNTPPSGTMRLHDLNDHGVMLATAGEDGGSGEVGMQHGFEAGIILPVEIAGDSDDDGDIDDDDRHARDKHPIVLQRKLNKVNTARTLVVRKIDLASLPVTLAKAGDAKIIVKSKQTGATLMLESQSESIDIGAFVSQADYEIRIEGADIGIGTLGLKVGNAQVHADPIPIRVLNPDIIFRNGSQVLADLVANNISHGGFDSGDGNVHDIGGSGAQTSTIDQFYDAAVSTTKRRVSFKQTNYMAGRIWEKIFDNMVNERFDNPSGAKPWNVFTTSENYTTSNCLEWLHKQWQRAVREVYGELQSTGQRQAFEAAYYNAGIVKDLAQVDVIKTVQGKVGLAEAYVAGLVIGADILGKGEIDKDTFHNQFEGGYAYFYPGYYGVPLENVPILAQAILDLWSEGQLPTFTPNSYLNSAYFEEVPY